MKSPRRQTTLPGAEFLVAGLVFVPALAVFAFTGARTVTFDDSGELALTAATLGIPHPPGYPTYALLGFVFSRLLPLGIPARELALMSGFFAALAAVFVALSVVELSADLPATPSPRRRKKRRGKRSAKGGIERRLSFALSPGGETIGRLLLQIGVPVSVGLAFAWSLTVWSYASVVEVYTVHLALLAADLWLLLRWRSALLSERSTTENAPVHRSSPSTWYLVGAGLLCGLAFGVHVTTILFALPGMLWLVLRTAGLRFLWSRPALLGLVALGLGLSVYSYLPFAASREPLFSWGAPVTWLRFKQHVLAQIYQGYLLARGLPMIEQLAGRLAEYWWVEITPLGLPLAALGAWQLMRRQGPVFQALLAIGGLGAAFALAYHVDENWDAYLLSLFLVTGVAAGVGLAWLAGRLVAGGAEARSVLVALLLLWPVWSFASHVGAAARHDDRLAKVYVEDVLRGVEQGGLLLTSDWHFTAPHLYLRHVEDLRPDVTVLDVNLSRLSWYLERYLGRLHPDLDAEAGAERAAYLEALHRAENLEGDDLQERIARHHRYLDAVLDRASGKREIYYLEPREPGVGGRFEWVPVGLVFHLVRHRGPGLDPMPDLSLEEVLAAPEPPRDLGHRRVRSKYAFMLATRAGEHLKRREYPAAERMLHQASAVDPELELPHLVRAELEVVKGDREAAVRALREALRINPANRQASQRLRLMESN